MNIENPTIGTDHSYFGFIAASNCSTPFNACGRTANSVPHIAPGVLFFRTSLHLCDITLLILARMIRQNYYNYITNFAFFATLPLIKKSHARIALRSMAANPCNFSIHYQALPLVLEISKPIRAQELIERHSEFRRR